MLLLVAVALTGGTPQLAHNVTVIDGDLSPGALTHENVVLIDFAGLDLMEFQDAPKRRAEEHNGVLAAAGQSRILAPLHPALLRFCHPDPSSLSPPEYEFLEGAEWQDGRVAGCNGTGLPLCPYMTS